MAAGASQSLKRFGDARDVLAQLANFARCADLERKRAVEKSAMLEQAEHEFNARRAQEIKRRDAKTRACRRKD
jgi:hypothetical protein